MRILFNRFELPGFLEACLDILYLLGIKIQDSKSQPRYLEFNRFHLPSPIVAFQDACWLLGFNNFEKPEVIVYIRQGKNRDEKVITLIGKQSLEALQLIEKAVQKKYKIKQRTI